MNFSGNFWGSFRASRWLIGRNDYVVRNHVDVQGILPHDHTTQALLQKPPTIADVFQGLEDIKQPLKRRQNPTHFCARSFARRDLPLDFGLSRA